MRARIPVAAIAVATGLFSAHAYAGPAPTIEFEAGPLASRPITSGSISGGGFTATGAPLIGSTTQSVLQFTGTTTLGVFNPLQVSVTEFNLSSPSGLANLVASITGVLAPSATISWAAYIDPTNTPFGTTDLIASDSFSDPNPLRPGSINDSVSQSDNLNGPFALTELLTITAPIGAAVSFSSSVSATAVPEPATISLLGIGCLAIGAALRRKRVGHFA